MEISRRMKIYTPAVLLFITSIACAMEGGNDLQDVPRIGTGRLPAALPTDVADNFTTLLVTCVDQNFDRDCTELDKPLAGMLMQRTYLEYEPDVTINMKTDENGVATDIRPLVEIAGTDGEVDTASTPTLPPPIEIQITNPDGSVTTVCGGNPFRYEKEKNKHEIFRFSYHTNYCTPEDEQGRDNKNSLANFFSSLLLSIGKTSRIGQFAYKT